MIKPASDFLQFVLLKPQTDAKQLECTIHINEVKYKDSLLENHFKFLTIDDYKVISEFSNKSSLNDYKMINKLNKYQEHNSKDSKFISLAA